MGTGLGQRRRVPSADSLAFVDIKSGTRAFTMKISAFHGSIWFIWVSLRLAPAIS